MAFRLSVFLALGLFSSGIFADVILKPLNTGKEHVGIIFVQGTKYNPDQFVGLLQKVQAMSELSVWVGIPQFTNNNVKADEIPAALARCLAELRESGMQTSEIFYVGEYVGGAYLQDYLLNHDSNASGLVLLGSFLSRENRSKFPLPSLTIGGGRDGLVRVTRIMEAYYHQVLHSSLPMNETCKRQAVVVLDQLCHSQFADGTGVDGIYGVDFVPTMFLDDAHTTIGWLITSFIEVHTGNDNHLNKLINSVETTGDFLHPLLTAFTMEGYYHFKPPCYDNPPSPSCTIGCGWTEHAMSIMAGLKNAIVNDTDGFHPVSEIKHIHHPKIHNTCPSDQSNCTLQVTSVSENVYFKTDKYDIGITNTSAIEIRAKLKSRQAVMEAVGNRHVKFNSTDGGSLCGEINTAALSWALSITDSNTLADYVQHGQPLVIGEDKGPYDIFPEWARKSLQFIPGEQDGKPVMMVHSIMMKTSTEHLIRALAGMHYCKLLSPARAIEWIYIDSRRLSETVRPKINIDGLFVYL